MLVVYKRVGQTPLDVIVQLKTRPELKKVKLSYAGRLDPLAHGVMLVLTGQETRNPQRFHGFEKTYRCLMLLGAKSDSYDCLGLISQGDRQVTGKLLKAAEKRLAKRVGKWIQEYPPYSSKKVGGKAMFEWARNGLLDQIKIPSKEVEVRDLKVLETKRAGRQEILTEAITKIGKVKGDFRQSMAVDTWREWARTGEDAGLLEFEVVTSAGLYIRSLCHQTGEELGCGALAFDIERIRVGHWRVKEGEELPVDGLKAV